MEELVAYFQSLKSYADLSEERAFLLLGGALDEIGPCAKRSDAARIVAARSAHFDAVRSFVLNAPQTALSQTVDVRNEEVCSRDVAFALWAFAQIHVQGEWKHYAATDDSTPNTFGDFFDLNKCMLKALERRAANIQGKKVKGVVETTAMREERAEREKKEKQDVARAFGIPLRSMSSQQILDTLRLWTFRYTTLPKPPFHAYDSRETDRWRREAVEMFRVLRARAVTLTTIRVAESLVGVLHEHKPDPFASDSDSDSDGERERELEPAAKRDRLLRFADDGENKTTTKLASTSLEFARKCRVYLDWMERDLLAGDDLVSACHECVLTDEERACVERLGRKVCRMAGKLTEFSLRPEYHDFIASRRLLACDVETHKIEAPFAPKETRTQILLGKGEQEAELPPTKSAIVLQAADPTTFTDFALSLAFRNELNSRTGNTNDRYLLDVWEIRGWYDRPPVPKCGIFSMRYVRKYGVVVDDDWGKIALFDTLMDAFVVSRKREWLSDFMCPRDETGKRVGIECDMGVFDSVLRG